MPEGASPEDQPKLFLHKPSKAQVKKARAAAAMDPSSAPPAAASGTTAPSVAPAPKRSFLRRLVPFLLAANLAVGAYVFLRGTDKKPDEENEHLEDVPSAPVAPVKTAEGSDGKKISETQPKLLIGSATTPVKLLPPVPEDQQRKLFKWILDEKRKIKATSPPEKQKIDEEKAILKRYIRAQSLPSI